MIYVARPKHLSGFWHWIHDCSDGLLPAFLGFHCRQTWLKLGVHSLLSNEPWKFSLRLSHRIEVPRPFPGILLCQTEGEHTSALVLLKAMTFESLRDAQKRIALCRECRDPFIPRKQQRYCRAGCSQTARTRKWRGSDAPRIKCFAQRSTI